MVNTPSANALLEIARTSLAIRGRWKKLSGRHGKRLSYKGKYIAVYDGRIIPTTAIHRSFGGHWVEYIRLRANFGAFVCHERIRDNGYKYGIKLKHLKKLAKAAESLAGPIPEQLERLVDLRQQTSHQKSEDQATGADGAGNVCILGREEAVQVEDDAEGQGTDRIDDDALLQEVRPQGRGLQQMQCILDRLENVQYYVAAIMEELHIIFNAVEE